MLDTIVYLIRHAETVDENGIRNTNEDSQMINEKEILSVYGEEPYKYSKFVIFFYIPYYFICKCSTLKCK